MCASCMCLYVYTLYAQSAIAGGQPIATTACDTATGPQLTAHDSRHDSSSNADGCTAQEGAAGHSSTIHNQAQPSSHQHLPAEYGSVAQPSSRRKRAWGKDTTAAQQQCSSVVRRSSSMTQSKAQHTAHHHNTSHLLRWLLMSVACALCIVACAW
jgi:hypothetical protein